MKDDSATPHILIVDDEVAIAYAFQRYFEHHGYRVSAAYDAQSALQIDRDDPIDGLVTDYRLPGMTGQDLLASLRAVRPDLPAIIVSGYTGDIGTADAMTRIVAKPVELSRLIQAMDELLAGKRAA